MTTPSVVTPSVVTPREFIESLREASIKRRYLEEQLHAIESELALLSQGIETKVWHAYPFVRGKEVNVVPVKDAEIINRVKSSVKAISHLLRDPNFYSDYVGRSEIHPHILGQLALYHMEKGERAQAKLYIDRMDMTDSQNRAVFSEFNNTQVIPTSEREFMSFCDQVYGGVCPIICRGESDEYCLE